MKPYSVIITHFQREENLRNTLNGLNVQTALPEEVIIVDMGHGIRSVERYRFDLKILDLGVKWDHMPLAMARNLGAEHSSTDILVFLDVDCIPSEDFCNGMVAISSSQNALVMGSPRYLLNKRSSRGTMEELRSDSIFHPARPLVVTVRKEDCYELFWSLCFAIPADLFEHIGGFDENYRGYGAEDTDFALEAKKAGVPFYLSGSEVYHQQHSVYVPPLNHLRAIVGNCNYFFIKWGYWPMSDCLAEFADMGYVDWYPETMDLISVPRTPTENEVARRLVKNAPYR